MRAESTTAVVGVGEIDEVAARLTGAGSVGEVLLERPRRRGGVATEVVRARRVDQRAITKGDGIAQGQIVRCLVRSSQRMADGWRGQYARWQPHKEGHRCDESQGPATVAPTPRP